MIFNTLWGSLYKGLRVPDRLNVVCIQKGTLTASWSLRSVKCFTKIHLLNIWLFLTENNQMGNCHRKMQMQVKWSFSVPCYRGWLLGELKGLQQTAAGVTVLCKSDCALMRYCSFKSIIYNQNHFLSAIFISYLMATRFATNMSAPSKSDKAALRCVLFAASGFTCCYRCWWYSLDNIYSECECT